MDETYIKVNGVWKYLYRAVDKEGKTVDFLLTAKRDKAAAMRFFDQATASFKAFTSNVLIIDLIVCQKIINFPYLIKRHSDCCMSHFH